MHLHIFKRGFSILRIENFWVLDPKTYYKIYTNAYICIYFSSATSLQKPSLVSKYILSRRGIFSKCLGKFIFLNSAIMETKYIFLILDIIPNLCIGQTSCKQFDSRDISF